MAEIGAAVLGDDQGGCGCLDLGEDLCDGGAGGHALWVGDVVTDTVHGERGGPILPHGGPYADSDKNSDKKRWWMGVSIS